jgi:hypothetical protein
MSKRKNNTYRAGAPPGKPPPMSNRRQGGTNKQEMKSE